MTMMKTVNEPAERYKFFCLSSLLEDTHKKYLLRLVVENDEETS